MWITLMIQKIKMKTIQSLTCHPPDVVLGATNKDLAHWSTSNQHPPRPQEAVRYESAFAVKGVLDCIEEQCSRKANVASGAMLD